VGNKIDLVGKRFGRLTVIVEAPKRRPGKLRWECQCDCGKTIISLGESLRGKRTKSCGCLHVEQALKNVQRFFTKKPIPPEQQAA
jgi:hypothetical protein